MGRLYTAVVWDVLDDGGHRDQFDPPAAHAVRPGIAGMQPSWYEVDQIAAEPSR